MKIILLYLLPTLFLSLPSCGQKNDSKHPDGQQSAGLPSPYAKLYREYSTIRKMQFDAYIKSTPEVTRQFELAQKTLYACKKGGVPPIPDLPPVGAQHLNELKTIAEKSKTIDYSLIEKNVAMTCREAIDAYLEAEILRSKAMDAVSAPLQRLRNDPLSLDRFIYTNAASGPHTVEEFFAKESIEARKSFDAASEQSGKISNRFHITLLSTLLPKLKKGDEWVPYDIDATRDPKVKEWANNTSDGKEWMNCYKSILESCEKIEEETGLKESERQAEAQAEKIQEK